MLREFASRLDALQRLARYKVPPSPPFFGNQWDRVFLNSTRKKSPEVNISQSGDSCGPTKIHAVLHQVCRRLLALLQGCFIRTEKLSSTAVSSATRKQTAPYLR